MDQIGSPEPEQPDFYQQSLRWFDSIGIGVGTMVHNKQGMVQVTPAHRDDLFNFGLASYMKEFPTVLNDPFIQGVAQLAASLQGYERKVGDKLYMRHVLATLGEAWEKTIEPYVRAGNLKMVQIMVASILLHDAVELQNKYRTGKTAQDIHDALLFIPGADLRVVNEIVRFTVASTPVTTASRIESDTDWVTAKMEEFYNKMALDLGPATTLFHYIKAADMAANIRETVLDYEQGLDKGMDRPIYLRILIFKRRIEYYKQIHTEGTMNPVLDRALELLNRVIIPLADQHAAQVLSKP